MNIKNVSAGPIIPLDPKNRVENGVRTKGSTDRDADGKRQEAESEQKRKLSDQDFEDALKILKDLPGLKANDLRVTIEMSEGLRVVHIQDGLGKTIRRLTESQLWTATRDRDKQTGRILDKAM